MNWKWFLLGLILILIIPIVPYEDETQQGIVEVKNKSIAVFIYEKYQEVQKQTADRIMDEVKKDAPVAQ